MAFKNIFKREKKGSSFPKAKESKEKAAEAKDAGKKEAEKPKIAEPVYKKERAAVLGMAYRILKTPHITEKASDLAERNYYAFNVYPSANKTEIKKALEDIYGVDVISVNIIKVPPKKRRRGKTIGFKKGYKKAIVKIKEGQKIEIMPR